MYFLLACLILCAGTTETTGTGTMVAEDHGLAAGIGEMGEDGMRETSETGKVKKACSCCWCMPLVCQQKLVLNVLDSWSRDVARL
jgi:hypothetical protein